MKNIGLNELRERFLSFFAGKGHLRLSSFSLIPKNDPSLLLINSGMAPLKPYFTGQEEPPRKRVTTCQKCIRTPDIENVGKTSRHGTFFEMLGNFSFGDYFKKEAITWAWEFIIEDLGFEEEKLWVSVYQDDDEAFDIWNRIVGLPAHRIVRMGKDDNFWEHGTGPCGPCSEIYFDRGREKGCGKPDCAVGCDCDRFVEFWNLVFTQFNKNEDGSYTRLANPNIDTGMGLERLACIVQGVDNLFEVDTVKNILDYICTLSGIAYRESYKSDVSIRVITDHARSTVMMVSDGIIPSNEGRGYVLRRLLRRASRHGRLLGVNTPFLYEVASAVIKESSKAYPELAEKEDYIRKVIRIEEERFGSTIDQGLSILNEYIFNVKSANETVLPGSAVFKLHDTYGFPLDLTREIAEENGLAIDEEGFAREMKEQKERARYAFKNKGGSAWEKESVYSELDKSVKTNFVGYDRHSADARIIYLIREGKIAQNAQEGDQVVAILDRTPFYAESGGQVGDTGCIESRDGLIRVCDCKKSGDGKYLHIGTVEKGLVETGVDVKASIDSRRRLAIARNHTATHLLHRALKNILGNHVNQAGSLVEPDRLRFDFTHFSPLSSDELENIEREINIKISEDMPVFVDEMSIDEAKRKGATALFDEKYASTVRVVSIGDYSMELCGGTHLKSSSQAGLIKIVGETGVAAGIRRVEALTGDAAIDYLNKEEKLLKEIASLLKTTPDDTVIRKLEALSENLKNAEKEIEQLKMKLVNASIDEALSKVEVIKGVNVLIYRYDQLDMEALRNTCDLLRAKIGSGVVGLASSYGGSPGFVVMATKDVLGRGVHSGNAIKEAAKIAGGGGGGRPDMAQAGGKDVSKIDEALEHLRKAIMEQIR